MAGPRRPQTVFAEASPQGPAFADRPTTALVLHYQLKMQTVVLCAFLSIGFSGILQKCGKNKGTTLAVLESGALIVATKTRRSVTGDLAPLPLKMQSRCSVRTILGRCSVRTIRDAVYFIYGYVNNK